MTLLLPFRNSANLLSMPVVNAPIKVEMIKIPHIVTVADISRCMPPLSSAAEPGSKYELRVCFVPRKKKKT